MYTFFIQFHQSKCKKKEGCNFSTKYHIFCIWKDSTDPLNILRSSNCAFLQQKCLDYLVPKTFELIIQNLLPQSLLMYSKLYGQPSAALEV